jgi:hypothetical protein
MPKRQAILRALQNDLPEAVKDCEKSVLEENPEMDKSTAIAICRDQLDMSDVDATLPFELDEDGPCEDGWVMVGTKMQNGQEVPNCVPEEDAPDPVGLASDCPDGQVKIGGDCMDVDTTDTGQVPPSLSAGAQFQLAELETEPIEREELADGEVVYRNVKILQSGTWTDSASGETIWYSPRGLENLDVTDDNAINIMHDSDNEVSEVGNLENARAESGELFADLRLETDTAAGQYADDNLQQTLETNGAKGFGGPSVEIDAEGQVIEFNEDRGVKELKKGRISGLGLVKNPASKPTAFARQTANRGVALSEGQTQFRLDSDVINMADPERIRETLEENGVDTSGMDDEELMSMAEMLHDELMSELQNAEHGNKEEEEEEEEEEMDMAGEEMLEEMQALKQRVEVLEDEVEQMEFATPEDTEELSEELQETKESLADAETVAELQDAKEELEKRLSELEDKPDKDSMKTLANGADVGGGSDDDSFTRFVDDPDPY